MAELTPGQVVRARRAELGISRERLARDVELSTSTLVRLELHDALPNVRALARIAERLGVSIESLAVAGEPARSAS